MKYEKLHQISQKSAFQIKMKIFTLVHNKRSINSVHKYLEPSKIGWKSYPVNEKSYQSGIFLVL